VTATSGTRSAVGPVAAVSLAESDAGSPPPEEPQPIADKSRNDKNVSWVAFFMVGRICTTRTFAHNVWNLPL
jgi:hypothetical protein